MGTIIGSIYPVDNITFVENAYRNQVSNPAQAAASGGATGTGSAVSTNTGGVMTNAITNSVLAKYGVSEPKPLATMTASELRGYKRVLERAVKAADSESDKNIIRLKITEVNSVLKQVSKEKAESFWDKVWGGMVTLSGVQPTTEAGQQQQVILPPDNTEDEEAEARKKRTNRILIGVGIGVGVLLVGTVTYLALRKK